MSDHSLNIGFVPLVDSAPLFIARDLGFAAEEGLSLTLLRQPSWSALRDLLALGHLDAAHMLSPLPIAMSLGLGGMPAAIDALMVMSVNGNVIGTTPAIAKQMRTLGWNGAFNDPQGTGQYLIKATNRRLSVGVPFPFSMHTELLHYWLGALGLTNPGELDIRIVPPQMMADAIAAGEIDAFCVGEPWGSIAVEQGVGELILPGSAIWSFAPEKVLAVRRDWIEQNPDVTAALMRAVWRATRWLHNTDNRALASDILARSENLDLPDNVIDRALSSRLLPQPRHLGVDVPGFVRFHGRAANFPWRSQAAWIGSAIATRLGLPEPEAINTARQCFRADLYRQHLGPVGADLPGASEKLEGALPERTAVASTRGEMILGPDAFFDGKVFDFGAIK